MHEQVLRCLLASDASLAKAHAGVHECCKGVTFNILCCKGETSRPLTFYAVKVKPLVLKR